MDEIKGEMIIQRAGKNANDRFFPEELLREAFKKANEETGIPDFLIESSEEPLNIEEFANCLTMMNRRRFGNIRSLQEEFDENMENLYKHFMEFHPDAAKRIKELLLMNKSKHLC